MKPSNLNMIQKSFSVQASKFENSSMSFFKQEYLDYTVQCIGAQKTDHVLEVAADTCVCGRAIAPYAAKVTCIDATPAMLEIGQTSAENEHRSNMTFINGFAEELPFPDESFDIVMTRLSFHHFTKMDTPFSEMNRVLKTGGKLVIIDMEAASENFRNIEDSIETMRDSSHIKNRSIVEFFSLYETYNYKMLKTENTLIPVSLQAWMDLTKTPEDVQITIQLKMKEDINGGTKTGFSPYLKSGELYFNQRWLLMIGEKQYE